MEWSVFRMLRSSLDTVKQSLSETKFAAEPHISSTKNIRNSCNNTYQKRRTKRKLQAAGRRRLREADQRQRGTRHTSRGAPKPSAPSADSSDDSRASSGHHSDLSDREQQALGADAHNDSRESINLSDGEITLRLTRSNRPRGEHKTNGVESLSVKSEDGEPASVPQESVGPATGNGGPGEHMVTYRGYTLYRNGLADVDPDASPVKREERSIQVPSWKVNPMPNLYTLEGTENLEDDVFLRRHNKPEVEEKRRKRWDLQRSREQEMLASRKGRGRFSKTPDSPVRSLYPALDDVKWIQVSEHVPVSVFCKPLPVLHSQDFSLPWFECSAKLNKPRKTRKKR